MSYFWVGGFFFSLLVDDHDTKKKPLHIYHTSQMIVSNLSNTGFVLNDGKIYFISIAFILKT